MLCARYIAGHKEYEVELQFSSNLLSYPDRTKTAEEAIDGDEPIVGSVAEVVSTSGEFVIARSKYSDTGEAALSSLRLRQFPPSMADSGCVFPRELKWF